MEILRNIISYIFTLTEIVAGFACVVFLYNAFLNTHHATLMLSWLGAKYMVGASIFLVAALASYKVRQKIKNKKSGSQQLN